GPAGERRWVWGAVAGCALLAAWELWIRAATGSLLPSAFTVKRAHEPLDLMGIARPTIHFLGVVGTTDLVLLGIVAGPPAPPARRPGGVPAPLAALAAWPAALAGVYLLTRFQMISRYWIPALPALLACAFVALERAFPERGPRAFAAAAYLAQQL